MMSRLYRWHFQLSLLTDSTIFRHLILAAEALQRIDINNKKHDYFAIFVLFDSIYTDFNRKIAFMA